MASRRAMIEWGHGVAVPSPLTLSLSRKGCGNNEGRRPRKPVPPIAGFARNPTAFALIKGCFMLGGGRSTG